MLHTFNSKQQLKIMRHILHAQQKLIVQSLFNVLQIPCHRSVTSAASPSSFLMNDQNRHACHFVPVQKTYSTSEKENE